MVEVSPPCCTSTWDTGIALSAATSLAAAAAAAAAAWSRCCCSSGGLPAATATGASRGTSAAVAAGAKTSGRPGIMGSSTAESAGFTAAGASSSGAGQQERSFSQNTLSSSGFRADTSSASLAALTWLATWPRELAAAALLRPASSGMAAAAPAAPGAGPTAPHTAGVTGAMGDRPVLLPTLTGTGLPPSSFLTPAGGGGSREPCLPTATACPVAGSMGPASVPELDLRRGTGSLPDASGVRVLSRPSTRSAGPSGAEPDPSFIRLPSPLQSPPEPWREGGAGILTESSCSCLMCMTLLPAAAAAAALAPPASACSGPAGRSTFWYSLCSRASRMSCSCCWRACC
mmetsp:Transcript_30203/g.66994  ORF Transcript_30203/g.66994 Transcript_30203/m.66994 type:complete len:345 (+) Transcript_30203:2028-3062(+)